jgi:metal-responsive CopG/Arc/MetJ family transcriptional regulator
VYYGNMPTTAKSVRRSVNLPARVARRVRALAQTSKTSTSRVIADLIESGLDARDLERKRFFECADRLSRTRDPEEQTRLKGELARMTFGV